jgi:TPR repeat protein
MTPYPTHVGEEEAKHWHPMKINPSGIAEVRDAQPDMAYGQEANYDRKAVELFEKAAEQGDPHAQNNLGWMYYEGNGVPQDYKKAIEFFEKAAVQGDPDAQNNLGS